MKLSSVIVLLSAFIFFSSCSKKEEPKQPAVQVVEQAKPKIPSAPVNEPADLLVPTDTSYNLARTGIPVGKKLAELTKDEKDPAFDEYSLLDVTTAAYTVQNVPLTVRVMRFPDEMNAYGYVAAHRSKLGSPLQLGSESYALDSVVMFSDGPYVVRVTSKTMNAQTMSAQSLLAGQISRRFGDPTASPPMFLLFPFSGRVGGTNLYHPKSYLGVDGLNKVYTSNFDVGGRTATFFITLDDGGAQFAALKALADKTPGTQPKAEDLGFKEGYAVRFVHPKVGVVVAGLVKGKLIGIAGYNGDAHQHLLTGWVQGLGH